jgi:hypothetical protein
MWRRGPGPLAPTISSAPSKHDKLLRRTWVWVGWLNVPGYHWHFLSDDRTVGGHVPDCRVREGRVQYEVCRDWLIK